MKTKWQKIETAPKDGTPIWAYLHDMGIRKLCYWSAEQIAEAEGGSPDDWEGSWCELSNYKEAWAPRFWLSTGALPAPPSMKDEGYIPLPAPPNVYPLRTFDGKPLPKPLSEAQKAALMDLAEKRFKTARPTKTNRLT